MLKKYAKLLVDYSLYLKKGEKLYIRSTTLAEPLIKEIYALAIAKGVIVSVEMSFENQGQILLDEGSGEQLKYVSPLYKEAMNEFDAYLYIRAPFNFNHSENDLEKEKIYMEARKAYQQTYYRRNGNGEMKRSLCQYPTQASAELAGMDIKTYSDFIFNSCKLFDDNPKESWENLSKMQAEIVNRLHQFDRIRYKNSKTDIVFSTAGRTWINSDGKTNMPSGEVYTSPVEDSVNGHIFFDFPTMYKGNDLEGIYLEVKNGEIINWKAEKGQEVLDDVFKLDGTRYFGEAAIGTNYNIKQATKNILFDEKIGGTIHMAIGQSYPQAGGKNKSSVHWDMISNMQKDGEIYGNDTLIYKNGNFVE